MMVKNYPHKGGGGRSSPPFSLRRPIDAKSKISQLPNPFFEKITFQIKTIENVNQFFLPIVVNICYE